MKCFQMFNIFYAYSSGLGWFLPHLIFSCQYFTYIDIQKMDKGHASRSIRRFLLNMAKCYEKSQKHKYQNALEFTSNSQNSNAPHHLCRYSSEES